MKKIALEEAIIQDGTIDQVPDHKNHPEFKDSVDALLEIGEKRIADMDNNDIAISVLSVTTPGLQGLATPDNVGQVAKDWNDFMAESVSQHPDRFKGLASIPTITAKMAIDEMERIIDNPAFVGCMINGFDSSGDWPSKYLDDPEYDAMWAAFEKRGFPIYVHPRGVPEDRVTGYDKFDALKGSAWGFHIETGEHMLRLMLSGVFDRFPKLKIIIGHMGEMLAFWAWRMDHRIKKEGWLAKMPCERTITDYLTNNFHITTSGYFQTPALMHAISTMGIDRVMFSVDYPYEDTKQASDWFDTVELSEEDKTKIAYTNAAKLLNLE